MVGAEVFPGRFWVSGRFVRVDEGGEMLRMRRF